MGAMNRRLLHLARRTARRRAPTRSWFQLSPLTLATRNIFDLGVVDLNGDGNLGVFTTNHNSRQSLLVNGGGGAFRDVLDEVCLNQDVAFPGWDDDVAQPDLDREGLYLYRTLNTIVVERKGGGQGPVAVVLRFLSAVEVGQCSDIDVEVEVAGDGSPDRPGTIVRCEADAGGRLELAPELVGTPTSVCVDHRLALSDVFVGSQMSNPLSHEFTLHLRDRHGMAWADHDGSGDLDVFVLRGGLKGRLEQFPGTVDDELFVRRGGRFGDVWGRSGVAKGDCRGRKAAWVDLEGGGPLALFVSCTNSHPRLYRRHGDGSFADVSRELGLDRITGGAYAWADVDGDGRWALLAVGDDELTVYRREGGGPFTAGQTVGLRNGGGVVSTLAVADVAGQGRPDVFVPSLPGNTLLRNVDGRYEAVDPRTVGLPGHGGITAHWVDFDNDGLVDLHVLPGGLFRQVPGRGFRRTGLLDEEVPSPVADVRVAWFDADNGGSRDVLIAVSSEAKVRGGAFAWRTRFFRNVGAREHWLQVELTGPPGNRQAIGAAVTVQVGDRAATQWVGGNEGSHYSQGHYRLYFGLGDHPTARSLRVRWPDGSTEERGPAGDELLRIAHVSPARRERGSVVP